jgi:hypothetical protein
MLKLLQKIGFFIFSVYNMQMGIENEPPIDPEANAIASISIALKPLDEEARARVFEYVARRFSFGSWAAKSSMVNAAAAPAHSAAVPTQANSTSDGQSRSLNEIDGIALKDGDDGIRITVRDLKARSGLDAAVRLAHIAIYACERLLKRPLSSRNELNPLLEEWRIYDGNTRARLAKEVGIVRDKDNLKLDAHARKAAEKYIAEALDESVSGRWKP